MFILYSALVCLLNILQLFSYCFQATPDHGKNVLGRRVTTLYKTKVVAFVVFHFKNRVNISSKQDKIQDKLSLLALASQITTQLFQAYNIIAFAKNNSLVKQRFGIYKRLKLVHVLHYVYSLSEYKVNSANIKQGSSQHQAMAAKLYRLLQIISKSILSDYKVAIYNRVYYIKGHNIVLLSVSFQFVISTSLSFLLIRRQPLNFQQLDPMPSRIYLRQYFLVFS